MIASESHAMCRVLIRMKTGTTPSGGTGARPASASKCSFSFPPHSTPRANLDLPMAIPATPGPDDPSLSQEYLVVTFPSLAAVSYHEGEGGARLPWTARQVSPVQAMKTGIGV